MKLTVKDFQRGDRFTINHRAYKPTEVFEVIELGFSSLTDNSFLTAGLRCVDIRELEARKDQDRLPPILTLLQQHLDVYDIVRVEKEEA